MRENHNATNVTLRPNITEKDSAWNLVPGDIVELWYPTYLAVGSREATDLQREERMYYVPCVYCHRLVGRIMTEGVVEACKLQKCPEFNRIERERV